MFDVILLQIDSICVNGHKTLKIELQFTIFSHQFTISKIRVLRKGFPNSWFQIILFKKLFEGFSSNNIREHFSCWNPGPLMNDSRVGEDGNRVRAKIQISGIYFILCSFETIDFRLTCTGLVDGCLSVKGEGVGSKPSVGKIPHALPFFLFSHF